MNQPLTHLKPATYQSSAILLRNKDRILFQKRDNNTKHNPNKWSFFGGGLNPQEIPLEAAIREFKEETGYQLQNPQLVYSWRRPKQTASNEYIFTELIPNNKLHTLRLYEGAMMGWFTEQEAKQLDFVDMYKPLLSELYAFTNYELIMNKSA
ncbi:MAG: NUDIX domain-containing protein [Candidatus Woesearchaeota archaeon]